MKKQPVLIIAMLLYSVSAIADAGFSIRRRTAPSEITFEGTGNLAGHRLFLAKDYRNPNAIPNMDSIDDADKFVVQDGGRNWDESERTLKFLLADPAGNVIDSFTVFMKKHNYHMVISGVKNNKLQYKMKRSKAYFNYAVIAEDDSNNNNQLNRLIFIACSMLGFVLLVLMFLKRRKIKLA